MTWVCEAARGCSSKVWRTAKQEPSENDGSRVAAAPSPQVTQSTQARLASVKTLVKRVSGQDLPGVARPRPAVAAGATSSVLASSGSSEGGKGYVIGPSVRPRLDKRQECDKYHPRFRGREKKTIALRITFPLVSLALRPNHQSTLHYTPHTTHRTLHTAHYTPHTTHRTPHTLTAIMPFTASDIIKIIFAIFLPPLGVFLERGCNADFFINILLTILGYIPGIIHALYIILKF
ncbi:hypothetical protein PMIN07_005128 [Paraphaeosphaeria minitans]